MFNPNCTMSNKTVGTLVKKFSTILYQRKNGNRAEARRLFERITADDSPAMPDIPMSHGLNCDPTGALFYIDHDWDDHGGEDPNWCNLFILDVINALKKEFDHRAPEYCTSPLARIVSVPITHSGPGMSAYLMKGTRKPPRA